MSGRMTLRVVVGKRSVIYKGSAFRPCPSSRISCGIDHRNSKVLRQFNCRPYGVYATLTDFKEERAGKRVLSRKGYIGIGLLVCSLVLSLSTDAFKDYQDHRKSQEDEESRKQFMAEQQDMGGQLRAQLNQTTTISSDLSEALKQLQGTSAKMDTNLRATSTVLSQTQRGLDPLPKIFTVTLLVIIRDQPYAASYIARIHPAEKVKADQREPDDYIQPRSELFPNRNLEDERLLAALANSMHIEILFAKQRETLANFPMEADLRLTSNCVPTPESMGNYHGEPKLGRLHLLYLWDGDEAYKGEQIRLECEADAALSSDNGSILSLRDFLGSRVNVRVELMPLASNGPTDAWDLRHAKSELDFVMISTSTGRAMTLSGFTPSVCWNGVFNEPCFMSNVSRDEKWQSSN